MAIQLDHVIVPSHDPIARAKSLAGLLEMPRRESQGSFTPVYVNETLTLDFAPRERFVSYARVDSPALTAPGRAPR